MRQPVVHGKKRSKMVTSPKLSRPLSVHFSDEHGFHVICDRCGKVATAKAGKSVWVEWGHPVHGDDDGAVICAECNKANPDRTGQYDATLGDVLLGVFGNAHEPITAAVDRAISANKCFGEGDLPWLTGEISRAAELLDQD